MPTAWRYKNEDEYNKEIRIIVECVHDAESGGGLRDIGIGAYKEVRVIGEN